MIYSVNVHYDLVLNVDVQADDEDEAMKLAIEKSVSMNLNEGFVSDITACVTDVME